MWMSVSDEKTGRHRPAQWSRSRLALCALAVTLVTLGGCGQVPTSASDPGAANDAKAKTAAKLAEVYRQLDGLDAAARRAKLVELAKAEGGKLTWYTAAADDDTTPLIKQFTQETGVDVQLYRASSATVLQRTVQEASAGRIRGDVLNLSGLDPTIASHEGLYAKLETPVAKDMVEGAVHDDWIADQLYPFVVTWNTNRVPKGQEPKSYRDLLTRFRDGNLAFESTDYNWLFGMVDVLTEQGMSEDEAIGLIGEAARGGVPVTGHTLISQLLVAGEYKATVNAYHYRSQRQVELGNPAAWQPALQPIITTLSGTGISASTERPAAALLFVEFQLTGEQEYWVKAGRTPTNKNYRGGIHRFDVELRLIDDEKLYSELSKWDKLYSEMMQSSGRPIKK